MKHLFTLLAAAALLCSGFRAAAQDDVLPDTADHGVLLQQVVKEWHDVGLYTAGWDKKPTIRNYFVGLSDAFPNDLFQMIVRKMLGLDVDDAVWDYVLDEQNGYISGTLGTETSPSVQMCYWNCNDGSRLIGVALSGSEYNMEETDPDRPYDEDEEEDVFVILNDIAFFRIIGDESIWRPVPVSRVCGREIDFRQYNEIRLPRQGKDIQLVNEDEIDPTPSLTLRWNGNGFTPVR